MSTPVQSMPSSYRFAFLFATFLMALPLLALPPTAEEVVARARAAIGLESSLKNLVTLQITGRILPAAPDIPEAKVLLTARRPLSQRLEVRIDDLMETTILNGKRSCMIRSNSSVDGSHQMRSLTAKEAERFRLSTLNFFNFYRPDSPGGETLTYGGIVLHRGVRCHRLVYTCPDGSFTTRFFAVSNGRFLSERNCRGIETVEMGEQSIGGIRFPQKIESFQDGRLLHTFIVEKVQVNKPLQAGIFTVPVKGQAIPVGK
ncbi:MAG: hypothetical protein ACON46_09005 [Coraliomargaritaceae bacterium]